MPHLRSLDIQFPADLEDQFPFNIPAVNSWEQLSFPKPVSFLVGENGSGKSTVLEALAASAEMITIGSENVDRDKTLGHVKQLSTCLKLTWNKRSRKGFFLRAEDFFGYVKRQSQTRNEFENDLKRVDEEYVGRSDYAKGLAKMPIVGELQSMERQYGGDLDTLSHGESFMTLFQSRFVPGGLYLLDEPEAPLSPIRQLAFLSTLKKMVEKEAQFIIATHSPILMSFTGAEIFDFDQIPIRTVSYNDLEHVNLTRDFLNNPEQFLKHL